MGQGLGKAMNITPEQIAEFTTLHERIQDKVAEIFDDYAHVYGLDPDDYRRFKFLNGVLVIEVSDGVTYNFPIHYLSISKDERLDEIIGAKLNRDRVYAERKRRKVENKIEKLNQKMAELEKAIREATEELE